MVRFIAALFACAALAAAAFTMAAGGQTALGTLVILVDATPDTATNEINTDHTITATVTDSGTPVAGYDVFFDVISGPNTGDGGQGTSDANGEATFTYTGDGGVGTDEIEVCAFIPLPASSTLRPALGLQQPLDCDTVFKEWVQATPTPVATPTPTGTAAPTATPTPTTAPAALPPTGSDTGGSGLPWVLVALVTAAALAGIAGAAALRRAR